MKPEAVWVNPSGIFSMWYKLIGRLWLRCRQCSSRTPLKRFSSWIARRTHSPASPNVGEDPGDQDETNNWIQKDIYNLPTQLFIKHFNYCNIYSLTPQSKYKQFLLCTRRVIVKENAHHLIKFYWKYPCKGQRSAAILYFPTICLFSLSIRGRGQRSPGDLFQFLLAFLTHLLLVEIPALGSSKMDEIESVIQQSVKYFH